MFRKIIFLVILLVILGGVVLVINDLFKTSDAPLTSNNSPNTMPEPGTNKAPKPTTDAPNTSSGQSSNPQATPNPSPTSQAKFFFAENFEAPSLESLFPKDASRWTALQNESADGKGSNIVELNTEKSHGGDKSLKMHARSYTSGEASKADIGKGGLVFSKGDNFWFSGWFYLEPGIDTQNLFLFDIESTTAGRTSPGRRLYLTGDGKYLVSDLGKWIGAPVFRQDPARSVLFPKGEWVKIKVHLFLSNEGDGIMEVWQNDTKVLDGKGQTLPKADTTYDRVQIGITANGNEKDSQTLYLDDVLLSSDPL